MSASHSVFDPHAAVLDLDRLRAGLAENRLARTIHYFGEISSTNIHARELADHGAAEGEVVLAESQTHGRGRLGRIWQSPPFANLYFSIVLRPKLPPAHSPQITLTAAVALAEALAVFIPQNITIKWPNDILVDGKKLAGILTEAACGAERVDYVILGIGVNVNYPVRSMPEEIHERATSIMELTGKSINRETLFGRLIQAIERCYGELERSGFAVLAPRWEAHFGLRGKAVRVELLEQRLEGRAQGIASDGALLIEDNQGKVQRVIAGDVIPIEI